jgi:alkanesulfonate monooxygenase SsuD/methylene tetrahydromethanopterin reductase-like flavin-dependent oxidoreductase (luciferase family)
MRYCLNLPNAGAGGDARTLAELAACAEDAGWDGVFLEDYILEDYIVYQGRQEIPAYDPWVALAAMALRTERIRLGTMVTPLARRRPWKLAREAVTLDHLSGGRLTLGVGLGDSADVSLTHFGEQTNARVRAAMLDEALDVLIGLWSGRPFRYDGSHYHVQEVTCLPAPLQTPRIPIWVGGAYPNRGPVRRAARWDGACLYKAASPGSAEDSGDPLLPEEIAALKHTIEARRTATTPFDIVVHGARRGVDETAERERLRASASAGATWCQSWIPPGEPAAMRAVVGRGPLRID